MLREMIARKLMRWWGGLPEDERFCTDAEIYSDKRQKGGKKSGVQ